MRLQCVAIVCVVTLSACSEQETDTLPPFSQITEATLRYTNCVETSARSLASESGDADTLARKAVESCRRLRAAALNLKGVPVMFTTVDEFDAFHLGFARQTLESSLANQGADGHPI